MSPTINRGRPLQYFIHDDFDALRMELSGSLAGRRAQKAYDAFRRAIGILRRQPLVIDVSYVTEVDELGKAILRVWHANGALILGSSFIARGLGEPDAPCAERPRRRTVLSRLASFFCRPTAGRATRAEARKASPALTGAKSTENAGLAVRRETEPAVR